jgi:hypothetical protein
MNAPLRNSAYASSTSELRFASQYQHNRITGTPENEITDDLAMISNQGRVAVVEKLEREI